MTDALPSPSSSRPNAFRAFTYIFYTELISLFRSPSSLVPTLVFPLMFWTFFGIPNGNRSINGFELGAYILGSYAAYSAIQTVLFNIGIFIAIERSQGFYKLVRVTPMQVGSVLLAKMLSTLVLALVALVLLLLYGHFTVNTKMALLQYLEMLGRALIGMLPFAALGAFVGYAAKGAQSASPILNLIFFPMAFGSGLFIPLEGLPKIVQQVAVYLPAYHSGQFTRAVVDPRVTDSLPHLFWILGYTVIFTALALWAYKRDEGANYR
jgi:ABC-2 type transport system permease protein